MNQLQKYAASAAMLGGVHYSRAPSNSDGIDSGINYQYFVEETSAYAEHYGPIASNCYDTAAQGIDLNDWYKYVPIRIRVSPAAQSSTGETMLDDWQRIKIIAPVHINYIGQGAMMNFEGNTWIVYKPMNVGGIIGDAVVRRCNSVINILDFYGNIVSIPMSFSKMGTQGNAPQVSENMILSKNYLNCICQLNDYTKQFTENSRMILGKAAYRMRGLNDFTREFTDEQDSAHLLTFTIEREEPLEQDNMELQCADYYSFSWRLVLTLANAMTAGSSQTVSVQSIRNGVTVEGTEAQPISYQYTSSDESVLTVDADGTIQSVGEGTATITVALEQNPDISQSVEIWVSESAGDYIAFTTTIFPQLREMDTMQIGAAFYSAGQETGEEVKFAFSGAPESTYRAEITGNVCTITALAASAVPLTVRAHRQNDSVSAEIWLIT